MSAGSELSGNSPTLTFLFTDIERHSELWESRPHSPLMEAGEVEESALYPRADRDNTDGQLLDRDGRTPDARHTGQGRSLITSWGGFARVG